MAKGYKVENGVGIIPEGTTEIEDLAFEKCTSLVSIVIPDSVKLIDDIAFEGCRSLSVVEFMGAVEEIGEGIFHECDHLTKILVPAGLTDYYKERLDEEVNNLIVKNAQVNALH